MSFVFSHEPGAPSALARLYHTLVHEFGREKVDEAFNRQSTYSRFHKASEFLS